MLTITEGTLDSNVMWRPVPGWEGYYEASTEGEIRSVKRTVQRGAKSMRVSAKTIALNVHHSGYLRVIFSRGGKRTERLTHQVIAEAFLGPRPAGMEVRHLDGDQTNNALSNLAYGTSSENKTDIVTHGRNPYRKRTHCPAGHELTAPNLVAAELKNGHRKCRACNTARAKVYRDPALAGDFQVWADHYYTAYRTEAP